MVRKGSCVSRAMENHEKGELTVLSLEIDVETVP